MAFKSKLLRKASTLSPKDQRVLGRLYELVGNLEVATGLRSNRDIPVDNKYLGRAIESIRAHTKGIEEALNGLNEL